MSVVTALLILIFLLTVLPDEIAVRIEDDGQVYLKNDPLDSPTTKELP